MSDQVELTVPNESHPNYQVGKYLFSIFLNIITDNPNCLLEKHKKINWQDNYFQEKIILSIAERLGKDSEEKFVEKATNIFTSLLKFYILYDQNISNLYIEAYISQVIELDNEITKLNNEIVELKKSIQLSPESSILLVDVENLALDIEEESYIKQACKYPLKHCLAFGNWKNLGQKDEELHRRGYELFHVPQGKNNADSKMTSIGSSILINHPNLKEIFVCSSDRDIDILCNYLSTKNISVYRIFRKLNKLCIKNLATEEILSHPVISNSKFLKLEVLIHELKKIIHQEITNSMNKNKQQLLFPLSQISALFCQKNNLSLNQIIDHHFPGQKAKYVFSEYKSDFVIHNTPNSTETGSSVQSMLKNR